MFKYSIKQLVATAIGAALFFVFARFLSIPIFANTSLTLQYAVLGFFAAVFGPIAGLLIGLIGHALNDLSLGYGIWWSWVIASALVGFLSGFLLIKVDIEEGVLGARGILQFIIGSLAIHLIAWGAVAPVLDILIYAEPADKVFTQGVIAGLGDFVFTAIIGTLLLVGYAKTKVKSSSLE